MIKFDESLLKPGQKRCEKIFFEQHKSLHEIKYPKEQSETEWDVDKIRELNKKFFKEVSSKNIVYALYVKKKEEKTWQIRYVGHSAARYSRSRLNNHLVKKSKKTGSKLEMVKENVYQGNSIGVIFSEIDPPELRYYFEAKIICSHSEEVIWNKNGK